MSRYFNKAKIIFNCNVIFCVINNINAGCCGNMFSNCTIDLDNFKYNEDVTPLYNSPDSYIIHFKAYNLDKITLSKIKDLYKEKNDLEKRKENAKNVQDKSTLENQISENDKKINELLLNKFIFLLQKVDGTNYYTISSKKTNINIKDYMKVTSAHKDYIDLYKKKENSKYDGYQDLSNEENKKIYDFEKNNGDYYILYKITKLQKKMKGDSKDSFVDYYEIVDIFKKK